MVPDSNTSTKATLIFPLGYGLQSYKEFTVHKINDFAVNQYVFIVCIAVRSRSLLFYNEGAPLEESLASSEGERLQSEGQSHIQTSRYTADAHGNQTTRPKLDRR